MSNYPEAGVSGYSPSRIVLKNLSMDYRSPGERRPNLDGRIRELLGETLIAMDVETEAVRNPSMKRSLLHELPTALSDIANTQKRRPPAGDKDKLEKATFNT